MFDVFHKLNTTAYQPAYTNILSHVFVTIWNKTGQIRKRYIKHSNVMVPNYDTIN
jgi:hypothetical protein